MVRGEGADPFCTTRACLAAAIIEVVCNLTPDAPCCTVSHATCSGTCIVVDEISSHMATGDGAKETKVSDRGMVTIPADLRRQLDIEPGDKLRWTADDDGSLSVDVVQQREGVFDDFDPVDAGVTNAVAAERDFGAE